MKLGIKNLREKLNAEVKSKVILIPRRWGVGQEEIGHKKNPLD
jgi:hypothetical protein